MRKVRRKIQSANLESYFFCSFNWEKICEMSEMRKMGLGKNDTKEIEK